MRTYGTGIDYAYYRKDIAKKYGIEDIKSIDDYKNYLDAVLLNEKSITPLAIRTTRGFYNLFMADNKELAQNHIVRLTAGGTANILLNEDNTRVVSIAYNGEDDAAFSAFPPQYSSDVLYKYQNDMRHEWKKYLEDDSINQKDERAAFINGKASSYMDTLDNAEDLTLDFKKSQPDGELGIFIIHDNVRNMEQEARITNLQANNFLAIPSTSKKKEAVLKFLDWLAADRENHDLFELGIEGKDWTASGEDRYSLIGKSGSEGVYKFPGYVMTWNPRFVRFDTSLSDEVYQYMKYDLDKSSYYVSPIVGFQFDVSNVSAEMSAADAIITPAMQSLCHGIPENPTQALQEAEVKAMAAGQNEIKEELWRQLDEFLAAKQR